MGIRSHLALGLAAVCVVILVGYWLASQTTRDAVDSVRAMQEKHEPLARRANSVTEKLVAYDRSVIEYLQAGRAPDATSITTAAEHLEAAVNAYFDEQPSPIGPGATSGLRAWFNTHVASGHELAENASQRVKWLERRRALLDQVQQRLFTAGGKGLEMTAGQITARRSLVDLSVAINAVRSHYENAEAIARAEKVFAAALVRYGPELMQSPGAAWVELVRDDFQQAVRLGKAIERFDATNTPARRTFIDDGDALMVAAQDQMQRPARKELMNAAERIATSAGNAERTLIVTGVAVACVTLAVWTLLAWSISVPVRRLIITTRRLALGNRIVRAPRGGSAEIDELAEAFNSMADHIAHADFKLRAHQAELERHVAERTQQLHHLAHHDPLTQLPNRRQLAARLSEALARADENRTRVTLLFVDLDNFKSINDTLGHNFGDRVLQGIADRLRVAAGARALLARLGGDEFTVLIEDVKSAEEVNEVATSVVTTLQQPIAVDSNVISTSASVGAALYPDHAKDAEALLRAADVALFQAKELGRNRYTIYRPALYDAAAQGFRLEQSLRRAVEAGDLMLMYQPQVSLHTFDTIGVEALLRWRKPDGRIASAGEFIHIAEKTGLVHELTEWVLRSATSTVAAWRKEGWHRACVAINVSPRQFYDSEFIGHVERALEVTGLPANALELELTEMVFQTGAATIESLHRLRAMGVSIALDDFGIGYSSLTSLEQLPLTRVKLDRMLVEAVDSRPRSAAIVRSIIALCHGLGLQVIAEGVERPAQLEFLSHCGPVGVQGFLLAHAVEAPQAASECMAAANRARSVIAAAIERGDDDQVDGSSLVFVGVGGRRSRLE